MQKPPDFCTLYIIDHPYTNFVKRRSALEKIGRHVNFIRSWHLCIILISPTEITTLVHYIRSGIACTLSTRLCGLYKSWILYNINRPGQTCRLNIRTSGLCIMSKGLTNITALYNVWLGIITGSENPRVFGRVFVGYGLVFSYPTSTRTPRRA